MKEKESIIYIHLQKSWVPKRNTKSQQVNIFIFVIVDVINLFLLFQLRNVKKSVTNYYFLRQIQEYKKVSGGSRKEQKRDSDEICENDFLMKDSQTLINEEESLNSSNISHKNVEESQEVNKTCNSALLERYTVSSLSTVTTVLSKISSDCIA